MGVCEWVRLIWKNVGNTRFLGMVDGYGWHLAGVLVDGDDRGLADDHSNASEVNQSVGGPEIDPEIIAESS